MKRDGMGGKPKPSRFSAKGAPPDDDAAELFVRAAAARAAARASRRAEHEVFDEGAEYFGSAPGRGAEQHRSFEARRGIRPQYEIDLPVRWAALFTGIFLAAAVVAGVFVVLVKYAKHWF
jgi:hypothetical protein